MLRTSLLRTGLTRSVRAASAPPAQAIFVRCISTAGLSAPINGYEESKRPKLFIPGEACFFLQNQKDRVLCISIMVLHSGA